MRSESPHPSAQDCDNYTLLSCLIYKCTETVRQMTIYSISSRCSMFEQVIHNHGHCGGVDVLDKVKNVQHNASFVVITTGLCQQHVTLPVVVIVYTVYVQSHCSHLAFGIRAPPYNNRPTNKFQ
jgi:hypothetical protein